MNGNEQNINNIQSPQNNKLSNGSIIAGTGVLAGGGVMAGLTHKSASKGTRVLRNIDSAIKNERSHLNFLNGKVALGEAVQRGEVPVNKGANLLLKGVTKYVDWVYAKPIKFISKAGLKFTGNGQHTGKVDSLYNGFKGISDSIVNSPDELKKKSSRESCR